MSLLDITGYLAAVLTTGSYIPQVIRVWRTRQTRDISFKMMLALSAGVGLWTVYGMLQGALPIIVANGASLALALTILGFKIRCG